MIKYLPKTFIILFLLFSLSAFHVGRDDTKRTSADTAAGDALIDFNFQSSTLPEGVTSNGTVSSGGSIGSCALCSLGRLNLPLSAYMQVDLPNVSLFKITAKSSGASARTLTVKYKIGLANDYTAAGTISVPQVGGEFILTSIFPVLITTSAISIRIENAPTGGEAHIHDLYAEANSAIPLSSEKEITSFKLLNSQLSESVINSDNGIITVAVPHTVNLTSVTPEIFSLSDQASVVPAAGASQDFSDSANPVVYTVTAEDGSQKQWTIIVNSFDLDEELTTFEAENAEFTGSIGNEHEGYTGNGYIDFLSSGDNSVTFTVCQVNSGQRLVRFRYALGEENAHNASLYVNNVFVSSVEFVSTASYSNWSETIMAVMFPAGVSSIKLTWNGDGPNLDKLSLGGEVCASFTLNVITTNGGTVNLSPARTNNVYFANETVTLLAENKPDLLFVEWNGDLVGTDNPAQVVMDNNHSITAHFNTTTAYILEVSIAGTGSVTLTPPGGVYAEGTVVTLTANAVLGTSFDGWSGDLISNASPETITMNANKSVTATFAGESIELDFETPVGFASVVTGTGTYEYTTSTFYGPVEGGKNAEEILTIEGPSDFDKLAKYLYNRNRAYRNASQSWGGTVAKAPLIIVLKEGVYPEGTTESSAWGNHMMTIQEQGDLTIIGQGNVVLKWGFNVKRSWNILIRNITFQDYYDDAINIGEPETHHIWVDHCTFGHPTTRPSDSEHPDGGVDVKGGANYVTVSWSKFRNSWKTNLIGHSDANAGEDLGKLKVTLYANHYYNSNSRNPRVRFGEVHVLNNLMEELTLYGIAASNQSQVYAENNFYLKTRWPMYADRAVNDFRDVYGNNSDGVFTSKTGNYACTALKAVGNEYDDSSLPVITAQVNSTMLNPGGRSIKFDEHNAENIFNPATYYSYTPYAASAVRTIVPLYAGAEKVNFFTEESEDAVILATGTLTSFEQTIGEPSESQSYTLSATDISGNLTITPPSNFEVSINQTNWFTNSNPLTIAHIEGAVQATTIYVRLNAIASGNHAGSITHTAAGASPVLKEVSGNAEDAPGSIPLGDWKIYEANQLPNAFVPAFVTSNQSGAFANTILADSEKDGNNLLHMQTTANGDNNQWRQNLSSGVGNITVVFRVKGNSSDKNLVFDADFDFNAQSERWQMRILTDGNYGIANGTPATGGSLGVNTLEWNIYRFTKKGTETALYVNENSAPIYTGTTASVTSGSNRYFRFGDGWGSGTIDSSIDWIVWDVSGAYSPAETRLPDHLTEVESTPTIVATGTLQSFAQVIGSPSDVQTYSVSGSNLTGNITITPPDGYEASNDNGTTWHSQTSPLILTHEGGTVASTAIQVRLNAASSGPHAGNIIHTSSGASTVNVAVTGVTSSADPVISVSGTLSAFTQTTGSPSAHQIYSVSGNNLTGNLTITPPAHFEVSGDAGTNWFGNTSPLVLTPVNGNVSTTDILVRLNASAAGTYSGNIVHTSSGATGVEMEVTGASTTGALTPTVLVAGTLNDFSQTVGVPSAIQTYTVSAINLAGNLVITPPDKFQLSGDNGYSWRTKNSPLILAPVKGTIPSLSIMVRLNSDVAGDFDGNISHTTVGSTAITKLVSGSVDAITGISKLPREVTVAIAPNPVNNIMVITRQGENSEAHVSIFSVTGVKVMVYFIEKGNSDLAIDMSSVEKGVYLMEYTSKQGRLVHRIIKL